MKTVVSALVALSVLGSIASVPASAAPNKNFWTHYDRTHGDE